MHDDTENDRCNVDIGDDHSLSAEDVGKWLESDERTLNFEEFTNEEIVTMAQNEDYSLDNLDMAESFPKVSHTIAIAAFHQCMEQQPDSSTTELILL